MVSKILLFIDGLCEPKNPGGVASFGFVAYKNCVKIIEKSGVINKGPLMSNNVAEYAALCAALECLLDKGLSNEEIIFRSDSRLLVNQMNGLWKMHRGLYAEKFLKALNLISYFKKISFAWIPREQNIEADSLSRKAYTEYCKAKAK
jgi:ribonuclease HI